MADLIFGRKWKVVRTIGAGGMGTVYEVEHLRLPRRRALKQLKKELGDNLNIKRRFDREARMMAGLDHPHIVTVHDVDEDEDNGAFILMDLVDGTNLAQLIQRSGRLPYREALRICREIASALDFAHSHDVVHRDLKPGNILIEAESGRAMLTDFGIAKQLSRGADETTGDPTTSFVGTYRYSSPEQMKSEEVDRRADLYSLGVVLYEACTGNRYLSEIREEAIPAHVMGYVPDWHPRLEFPDDLPDRLCNLIRDCLQLDRSARIQSAAEIVRRLRECESEEPGSQSAGGTGDGPVSDDHTEVTREESYVAQRAASRSAAEEALARIERLGAQAGSFGVVFDDEDTVGGLRDELAEIDALEQAKSFGMAYRRLDDLRDEAAALALSRQARLAQALRAALAEHEDLWGELTKEAGDLLGAALAERHAQRSREIRGRIDAGELTAAGESIAAIPPLIAEARAEARRSAEARVAELSDRVAALRKEVQATGGDAALADVGADIEQSQREARAALEEGHFRIALERMRDQCAHLEEQQRANLERQRAEVERARRAAAAVRAALDAEAAEALAGASLHQLETAQRDAEQAVQRGELARARELFEQVRDLGGDIEQVVARDRGERFEVEKQRLAELIESADAAADEVVGAARQEAQAAAALETADAKSLQRLAAAQQRLRDALAEDALRREALEQRDLAARKSAAVAVETLPRNDVEAARRATAKADSELAARQWRQAAASYAAAGAAWEALRRRQISQEQAALEEQLRAATGALDEIAALTGSANAAGLEGVAPRNGEEASLRQAARNLGDGLEQADLAAARQQVGELSTAAAAMVEDARGRIAQALRAEVDAHAARLKEEFERAGRFAEGAGSADVAAAVGSVRARCEAGELAAAIEQLTALETAHERFTVAVATAADEALAGFVEQARRLAALLTELGAVTPVDIEELSQQVERECAHGAWEASCVRAEAAVRDLEQTCEAAGKELVQRARAGEEEARTRAASLPLDAAEVEVAERASAAAGAAAERGEWTEAARLFAAAGAGWKSLLETGERRAQEIAAARSALEPQVERAASAPAEVVGAALQQAEELLAQPSAEPGPLREAAAALAAALDAVPRFERACAQRDAFQARLGEREAAGVRSRSLKASRKRQRAAETAFARGDWDQARTGWADAEEKLPPVPVAGEKPDRRPLLMGSVAAGLAALSIGLYAARDSILPKPTPTSIQEEGTPLRPTPAPPRQATAAATVAATAPPLARHPSIVEARPPSKDVRVAETESQDFSVKLADADANTPVEWTLDGDAIADARGKTKWTYEPDYDANASSPHRVAVQIGEGTDQKKQWEVQVDDKNRPPRVIDKSPSEQKLEALPGKKLTFRIDADDPDGDTLKYQWKDRGKVIGSGRELTLKVTGGHEIQGLVSDGKGSDVPAGSWNVALAALPPLDLSPKPARLSSLEFARPQTFELNVPTALRRAALSYSWTINGKSVANSSTPSYRFANDDPRLVRNEPVVVSVVARANGYTDFKNDWKFKIEPPAPRIAAASPVADQLDGKVGSEQVFEVEAANPIGDQKFTYVFSSAGKETRSAQGTFRFTPSEKKKYTVVASIVDNYGQKSAERRWTIEPSNDLELVRAWLDELLAAERKGRVDDIARLRGLGSGERQRLERSMTSKSELQLNFADVRIEPVGDTQYRISYRRQEKFRDPAGKSQSFDVLVKDRVRLDRGRVIFEGSS